MQGKMMKSGQIFMTAMKKTGLIYGRESYSENNSRTKRVEKSHRMRYTVWDLSLHVRKEAKA